MHFTFDLDKTIQAAAQLLRLEMGQQMSRLRLLKLLYIADRESLRDTGWPITGDSVIAMKHGPVLGTFYDVIKGEDARGPTLDRYIGQQGYQLTLIEDPGKGRLNRYEIRKLQELSDCYRNASDWDIAEETHEFEEWKANDPGNSSRPIPLEDILSALGYSPEKIKSVIKDTGRAGCKGLGHFRVVELT